MAIKIKPSKKGTLRKTMHAEEGKKLSVAAMRKKMNSSHTSPAMKKKLVFAMNARKWKHEDGGLIEYGDGGFNWEGIKGADNIKGGLGVAGMAGTLVSAVGSQKSYAAQGLGGAAQGAAAGMVVGPIGAIAGGIIGGVGGLLGAGAANKAEDAQAAAELQARQGMIQANQQSDATENPYAATFAEGGIVGKTNDSTLSMNPINNFSFMPQPMEAQSAMVTPRKSSIYTPPGGGNWAYNGGADQWFNTINRDKQGKPSYMTPENYEKQYPNQLRQTGYRELYAQGGMMPQGMPNAELEKQEVTQGPDGSMMKMNMPSHANATGKNQVALESGTRIYSDKLKPVGEKKKTYADLADEIRKDMAKYEQKMYA